MKVDEALQTIECLGGFRRLAVIGSGAQGAVWKAECVEVTKNAVAGGWTFC